MIGKCIGYYINSSLFIKILKASTETFGFHRETLSW